MKANVFNNFYATTGVVDDGRGGATVLKIHGTILRGERSEPKKIFYPPPLFGQWGGQNIA